jgi:hypothetical protein
MAEWTRADMREEFFDGGFRYFSTARANRFLETAMAEFIAEHQFPFREVSELVVQGEPVSGLGQIEQVTLSDDTVLEPARLSSLVEYGDGSGTARCYYLWGQDTIYCWPASDDTILVRHYSLARWIDPDTEERMEIAESDAVVPVVPPAYIDIPLLKARANAKRDVSNLEEAAALDQQYEDRLDDARATLNDRQVDEPLRIKITNTDWA